MVLAYPRNPICNFIVRRDLHLVPLKFSVRRLTRLIGYNAFSSITRTVLHLLHNILQQRHEALNCKDIIGGIIVYSLVKFAEWHCAVDTSESMCWY